MSENTKNTMDTIVTDTIKIKILEQNNMELMARLEKLEAAVPKSSISFVNPETGIVTMPDKPFTIKGKQYEFTAAAFVLPNAGRVIAAEILNPEVLEEVLKYPDLYKPL